MTDNLTICLKADEATVKKLLTDPPFSQQYVRTIGGFTADELDVYVGKHGATPEIVFTPDAMPGEKVLIHTRS
jgi:hypothetical protein